MIDDFVSKTDLPLFTSGSRFTLGAVFFQEGLANNVATFDLLVRELPPHRNYLVCAGLEQVVDYLLNLRFTAGQLKWIQDTFKFSPAVMGYFKNFKFRGDLWALSEGSLFFPGEPIMRFSAPIIEAQFIEMFLINTVFTQIILASKMARFVDAAQGRETYLGFNRCDGTDAAMKSIRIGQIVGIGRQSLALAAFKNSTVPLMARGTFHYLIQMFPTELAAFRAYMRHSPSQGSLLIDTYGIKEGIKNFILAAHELKRRGHLVNRVMIDSGDLYKNSCLARRALDKAGLPEVKIIVMSNLDEYKIHSLLRQKAPIDGFAGVTEILNSTDAPALEVVYKLAEMQKGKIRTPVMKLSKHKPSLPGRKQVWRVTKNSKYHHDVIGLANEKLAGQKLLVPIIKNGKLIRRLPTLKEIGQHYQSEIKKLPERLRSITQSANYQVHISPNLQALTKKTKLAIIKSQQ